MFKKILCAVAVGSAALGAQAASSNLLTDGDFESTGLAAVASSYCYVPDIHGTGPQCGANAAGWTGGIFLTSGPSAWGDPASQTHTGIDLGGVVTAIQANTTLTSDFSAFVVGQEYLVTWDATGRDSGEQTYSVSAGGVTDGTVFSTVAGTWETYSFDFVATSASPLVFQGLGVTDVTSFVDNVSVTAVPEPSSILMMVAGTLGLLAWRRRAQV